MRFEFHERITTAVLRTSALPVAAQRVVLWGNWSVDYYNILAAHWPSPAVRTQNLRFHFANLADGTEVAAHWDWLTTYGRRTLTGERSPGHALYQVGRILHAVQDFYAHTNWVELAPAQGLSGPDLPTWEERSPALLQNLYSFALPDSAGYDPARDHAALHKDEPGCPAGPLVFAWTAQLARRATQIWWSSLLSWLPHTTLHRLPGARPGPWAWSSRRLVEQLYIRDDLFQAPVGGLPSV